MEWESSHFYPFPPALIAQFSPLAFGIGDIERNRPESTHITAEASDNEVGAINSNTVAGKIFVSCRSTFAGNQNNDSYCVLII